MSYTNQDDGITYASVGEHYHVSGYVTVRVYVSFDTDYEPDDSKFDEQLRDEVSMFDDWEIEDDSDLEYEIEGDEYDD